MIERFFPAIMLDRIQSISAEFLLNKGIKGLILDIDNTLVPEHMKEADENAVAWLENMKAAGFKLCIVSNASRKRVIKFNEKLSLHAIHRASKPGTKAFLRAAGLLGFKNENIAVVGDQIFTDIYGGNKAGMYTILVRPINKKEGVFIRMKRIPEKFVLSSYGRKKD